MRKNTTIPLVPFVCAIGVGLVKAGEPPRVELQTNWGTIVLELESEKSPQTVANFLAYVREGFYDGTVFHRVIDGFMIQGGGYTPQWTQKQTKAPIKNEAANGLKNTRGSLAMARTGDPHSATAQFFVNVADNPFLDYQEPTVSGWGYTVFGRVIQGMDVVDRIKAVPTGRSGPFPKDAPQQAVIIERAIVLAETEP
ncbi:MAG: peptidylprolyl isomerase [Gammaproteobacteria bacterium]